MGVQNSEILYRYVNPSMWVKDENRISTALFKDKNGVSVDRDMGRSQEEVISSFEQKGIIMKGIVSIKAGECREIGAEVIEDPIKDDPEIGDNPYHALIQDSVEQVKIKKSKIKQLSEKCKLIKVYE